MDWTRRKRAESGFLGWESRVWIVVEVGFGFEFGFGFGFGFGFRFFSRIFYRDFYKAKVNLIK